MIDEFSSTEGESVQCQRRMLSCPCRRQIGESAENRSESIAKQAVRNLSSLHDGFCWNLLGKHCTLETHTWPLVGTNPTCANIALEKFLVSWVLTSIILQNPSQFYDIDFRGILHIFIF